MISVHSEGPGHGSSFTVVLPLVQQVIETEQLRPLLRDRRERRSVAVHQPRQASRQPVGWPPIEFAVMWEYYQHDHVNREEPLCHAER
jgi:hypothetical protein